MSGSPFFGGLGFGCFYEVRKAWSERVRSNILAEMYEVDVPEAQQRRKRFDITTRWNDQCHVSKAQFIDFTNCRVVAPEISSSTQYSE